MKILGSASKIVFVLMALTSCVALIIGKLPTDQYMLLVSSAFAFYFSNKGSANEQNLGK